MLLGSNIFPSHVSIGLQVLQLGDIVRRAFKDSGLSVDEWNGLTERDRDLRLVNAYYDMRDGR